MSDRTVEGTDLWNATDPAGRPYIQELCARAQRLNEGEVAEYQYQRAARLGGALKAMRARFAYVPELNWVVGFTQPESESLAATSPLGLAASWSMWLLLGVGVVGAGTAARIWMEFADDLTQVLNRSLLPLRRDAQQLTEAARALAMAPGPTNPVAGDRTSLAGEKQQPLGSLASEEGAGLQRQAEALLHLAEGIDRTVGDISVGLGIEVA
jgi:hypothetical protein